jgi:hypothetical protein
MNEIIKGIHKELDGIPDNIAKSLCITGSSMLVNDHDFNLWDERPDIDLFAYNSGGFAAAVTYFRYAMEWPFGTGTITSKMEEELKYEWSVTKTWNWGSWNLVTIKLMHPDDIIINISCRKGTESAAEVVCNFDMTPVMIAKDLWSGEIIDLRGDPNVARVNPFKRISHSEWSIERWLRQITRVEKYEARGFDVTPISDFYIKLLQDAIEYTKLFNHDGRKEELREAYKEQLDRLVKIREEREEIVQG